jgi:uncharacterized membrane protein (Fun14 family)
VVLEGLALFRERTRALETTGGSGSESDSGSWSGISTSMTDLGEGSLVGPPIGLASGWELQAVAKAVAVAVAVAVFGTVCIGWGPVALTWNLDGLQV